MGVERGSSPLESFEWEGQVEPVSYVTTENVAPGVRCEVYTFVNDPTTKDLGIIFVEPGHATPRQRVLQGEVTYEGYISGEGVKLEIVRKDGSMVTLLAQSGLAVAVMVGDIMQWRAGANSPLKAFEVCFPPYAEGRYETVE